MDPRWDEAPSACAAVANRLPMEGPLFWHDLARPDLEYGHVVAGLRIPAWDRDPPPEWCPAYPEPGQLGMSRALLKS